MVQDQDETTPDIKPIITLSPDPPSPVASSPPLRSISRSSPVIHGDLAAPVEPLAQVARFAPKTAYGDKQCTNCGELDTPQWRGTLCNACALWKRSRGTDRPLPLLFPVRRRSSGSLSTRTSSSASPTPSSFTDDDVDGNAADLGNVVQSRIRPVRSPSSSDSPAYARAQSTHCQRCRLPFVPLGNGHPLRLLCGGCDSNLRHAGISDAHLRLPGYTKSGDGGTSTPSTGLQYPPPQRRFWNRDLGVPTPPAHRPIDNTRTNDRGVPPVGTGQAHPAPSTPTRTENVEVESGGRPGARGSFHGRRHVSDRLKRKSPSSSDLDDLNCKRIDSKTSSRSWMSREDFVRGAEWLWTMLKRTNEMLDALDQAEDRLQRREAEMARLSAPRADRSERGEV